MMGITLLLSVLCLLAVVASGKTLWHELEGYTFERYVKEYSKLYNTHEQEYRRAVFEENFKGIITHNANPSSWKMGVNHMTDWTDEEFRKLLGYKKQYRGMKFENQIEYTPKLNKVLTPNSIDWRGKGIVTPVKDQGECGSCWSFGTAEVIESYYALATGQLATLSEQQILDCVPNPDQCGGTGGCGGGTVELAFQQIIDMGGLASEWTYPYTSYFGDNYQCHYNANTTKPIAQLSGFVVLPSNEYQPVMDQLAEGPLAINIDASSWRHYEGGVFTGCNQTNADVDHVVLLVGYGTDATHGGDYWLVRNSWTPAWGEDGYIRLTRSSAAQCTPDTMPSDGTGCNDGPPEVIVCGACGILYDVSYPVIVNK